MLRETEFVTSEDGNPQALNRTGSLKRLNPSIVKIGDVVTIGIDNLPPATGVAIDISTDCAGEYHLHLLSDLRLSDWMQTLKGIEGANSSDLNNDADSAALVSLPWKEAGKTYQILHVTPAESALAYFRPMGDFTVGSQIQMVMKDPVEKQSILVQVVSALDGRILVKNKVSGKHAFVEPVSLGEIRPAELDFEEALFRLRKTRRHRR